MNRALVRAGTVIVSLACLTAGTAIAASKKSAFDGTWTVNVAKSTFDPAPGLTNGKVVLESVKGGMKFTGDVTMADGQARHITYAGPADGTNIAVTGSPNWDSITVIQPDRHTIVRTERRGGKVVGVTIATLAANGKSYTAEARGTTAAGQKYHNVTVWERAKH